MSETLSDAQICLYLRGGGAQFPVPQLAASRIEALTTRIAALEVERDAALGDAKRYQWLRDRSVPPHQFYISVPVEFEGVDYKARDVDAYIDDAISRGDHLTPKA